MTALEEARKNDGVKLTETLGSLMEKTQMVINLSQDKEQLQKQVQYYSERFEDFNDTLTKSNQAISEFRNRGQRVFIFFVILVRFGLINV